MFENETIESIEDWNTLLVRGGGVALPIHPQARIEFEAKSISWPVCGWNFTIFQSFFGQATAPGFDFNTSVPCPDRAIIYRKVESTTTDPDGTTTFSVEAQPFSTGSITGYPTPSVVTGTPYESLIPVDTYASGVFTGGSDGYTIELKFSDPVSWETVIHESDVKRNEQTWSDSIMEYALFLKVAATCGGLATSYPSYVQSRALRYRMGIPFGYDTPYFNVKWDEVFYPKAWLEWNAADPETRGDEPSKPKIIKSREWTYSNGEFSDWFEIDRPDEEGQIHIRNVRTLGYRTPWGNAPHFQGERFKP